MSMIAAIALCYGVAGMHVHVHMMVPQQIGCAASLFIAHACSIYQHQATTHGRLAAYAGDSRLCNGLNGLCQAAM